MHISEVFISVCRSENIEHFAHIEYSGNFYLYIPYRVFLALLFLLHSIAFSSLFDCWKSLDAFETRAHYVKAIANYFESRMDRFRGNNQLYRVLYNGRMVENGWTKTSILCAYIYLIRVRICENASRSSKTFLTGIVVVIVASVAASHVVYRLNISIYVFSSFCVFCCLYDFSKHSWTR